MAWDYQPGITHQYSLNQQVALSRGLLFEIGYVGALSQHQIVTASINQAGFASPTNPIREETTNTLANIKNRVRWQGFVSSGMSHYQASAKSWYNAMQATLTRRYDNGLQFQAAYTFSKTLSSEAVSAGDRSEPNRMKGPVSYDRPHRLIVNYSYDLPISKGKTGFSRILLNGWRVAGVTTIQSGTPLTIMVTNSKNYAGITSDFAQIAPGCFGNLETPGPVESKLNNYFDVSCIAPFTIVDPSGTTGFGNGPTAATYGPGQNNTDISLSKITGLGFPTESSSIEFRVEFFNAFNHPQFANPNARGTQPPPQDATPEQAAKALGPSFGRITSTSVSARIIQFALKFSF
jgi:hypothetical protein